MPFCPECKSEYRTGFTDCADCQIPLVEKIDEELKPPGELIVFFHGPAHLPKAGSHGTIDAVARFWTVQDHRCDWTLDSEPQVIVSNLGSLLGGPEAGWLGP